MIQKLDLPYTEFLENDVPQEPAIKLTHNVRSTSPVPVLNIFIRQLAHKPTYLVAKLQRHFAKLLQMSLKYPIEKPNKPNKQYLLNGEPIKLPDNLESLPRADSFPSQRHRWNTNEEFDENPLQAYIDRWLDRVVISTCRVSVSNMVLSAVQKDHNHQLDVKLNARGCRRQRYLKVVVAVSMSEFGRVYAINANDNYAELTMTSSFWDLDNT
uniref:Uncharacterized protein n=1 Tax=Glossina austeni TaxID=7395 RepID=A0A1A9V7J7_GLOAU